MMAVDIVARNAVEPQSPIQACTLDSNRFEDLVVALKKALGPSSGLTSDDVDVAHLMRLMEQYQSAELGWVRFAMGDASRGYTRNLVDEGNGKSNLVCRGPPFNHRPPHLCLTTTNTARACLDARQGQPHPRPRQCPLPDEDSSWQPDRNPLRLPPGE